MKNSINMDIIFKGMVAFFCLTIAFLASGIYQLNSAGYFGIAAIRALAGFMAVFIFIAPDKKSIVDQSNSSKYTLFFRTKIKPVIEKISPVLLFVLAIAFIFSRRPSVKNSLEISSVMAPGWLVTQGGGNPVINSHYSHINQRHSIDLVKVNPETGKSWKDSGDNLTDYLSWDQPVYSPVNGYIKEVRDNMDDSLSKEYITDDSHDARGNYIIMQTDADYQVTLAHFKRSSILVKPGDSVEIGQILGHCGSSGNSSEPHIHLQANDKKGKSVPIAVSERTLCRGDLYQ